MRQRDHPTVGAGPPSAVSHAPAAQAGAPQASSLSYGISADYLTYATTPEGREFGSAVLGNAGHVRIFAPYDTLSYWDGRACAASPSAQAGATVWDKLQRLLVQTKAAGVAPEVVFAEGTGAGGVPVTPDPADPVQANDYVCGVRALMQALFTDAGSSFQMPVQFEAWNEPENDGYAHRWNVSCRAPAEAVPSCSGPWRAAMLWYIAQTQANSLYTAESGAGFPRLTVAALAMSAPQKLFFLDADHLALSSRNGRPFNGYYQSLYRIVHCAPGFGGCQQGPEAPTAMPTVWSVHDFDDPTAMGTADLRGFETALARLNDTYASGAGAQVWITESGVQLDSLATNDLNLPAGTSCRGNDIRGYDARTFGCLQDNRPESQAAGAAAWKSLGTLIRLTKRGEVAVSEVYWYHFQLPSVNCTPQSPCELGRGIVYDSGQVLPELHSWDSALVDSNGDGRSSFCVVTGTPVTRCAGSPHDYEASRWYPWWKPAEIPTPCPAHFGAWVADKADSGLPNGEECQYDASTPPTAAGASSSAP